LGGGGSSPRWLRIFSITGRSRMADADFAERAHAALATYHESLADERRVLLDRYRLVDFALKVVGIGSVGTRCYVALLMSDEDHPLLLQFKEAGRSAVVGR